MKKSITTFIFISLIAVLICLQPFQEDVTVYRNLLIQQPQQLTGPDKANYRDFQMTVDLNEKRVPKERVQDFLEKKDRYRIQSRDFAWREISTEISGRTRCFYWDEENQVMWSGAVTGGLWKNEDFYNNGTWQEVVDLSATPVSSIVADPTNSNTLYLGTGESFTAFLNYRESSSVGNGVYKSTDGGATWTMLPSTEGFAYVNDLVIRNENGNGVIYAAVGSGFYKGSNFASTPSDGIYRSEDGGTTWSQVGPNQFKSSVPYMIADLELASDNTLYAGTMRNLAFEGGGVVLISENGTDWTIYDDFTDVVSDLSTQFGYPWEAGRVVIETSLSNPNHVYAIFMAGFENVYGQFRDYETYLFQSLDKGTTWSEIALPSGWSNIPWHAAAIAVDPNNEHKVVIGALDVFSLEDASAPSITDLSWNHLSSWSAVYAYNLWDLATNERDSLIERYVHADLHAIQFINGSSDEVVMATDGGIFYTPEMTKTSTIIGDLSRDQFPVFYARNQKLNTTQYYTVALDPTKGSDDFLGGTQDNGTLYNSGNFVDYNSFVSGGDGSFCFYDEDDPSIFITSIYTNIYIIFKDGQSIGEIAPRSGLFVNPGDYDSRSNLLYTNMMSGPQGGLFTQFNDRFLDSLLIINVNHVLGQNSYDFDEFTTIRLGGGVFEPITAIKVSPHSPENNACIVFGTHYGKVYKSCGLPASASTTRIDDSQLPVGYISSVDIGSGESRILVTYSNYGTESVWLTRDGGASWRNIEYNLPDIPVRWGVFNPEDDKKIMIATEVGVWGLENTEADQPEWIKYEGGLPDVRVDMIELRANDSTIIAATHGRGMFLGKYDQGEKNTITHVEPMSKVELYPNPVSNRLNISLMGSQKIELFDLEGKQVIVRIIENGQVDLSDVEKGIYVAQIKDSKENILLNKKIIKR